jgi:hypothetical protein
MHKCVVAASGIGIIKHKCVVAASGMKSIQSITEICQLLQDY